MRARKALAAAGLAAFAAPAMACDLEAFGEQRFSAFGAMHMAAPQAPEPVTSPEPADQQQGSGSDDASSKQQPSDDQASASGDAPSEDADGAAKPASGADGQGDAATFR